MSETKGECVIIKSNVSGHKVCLICGKRNEACDDCKAGK